MIPKDKEDNLNSDMSIQVDKIIAKLKSAFTAGGPDKAFLSLMSDVEKITDITSVFEIIDDLTESGLISVPIEEVLFDKALEFAEEAIDLHDIAEYMCSSDFLEIQSKAKGVFTNFIDKLIEEDGGKKSAYIVETVCDLAESVSDNYYFEDKVFARELLKKAVDYCSSPQDYCDIAATIADERFVGDKVEAVKLYKTAIANATTAQELSYIAQSVFDNENLGDKKGASNLLSKAINLTENPEDVNFIPGVYRRKDFDGGSFGITICGSASEMQLIFDGNNYYEGEWDYTPFDDKYFKKSRMSKNDFFNRVKDESFFWVKEL